LLLREGRRVTLMSVSESELRFSAARFDLYCEDNEADPLNWRLRTVDWNRSIKPCRISPKEEMLLLLQ